MKHVRIILALLLTLALLMSVTGMAEGAAANPEAETGALIDLPEELLSGFDMDALNARLSASTSCEHELYVDEDRVSLSFRSLGDMEHEERYLLRSRSLRCYICEEVFQTVTFNKIRTEVEEHGWVHENYSNVFTCNYCDAKMTVQYPCKHKKLHTTEGEIFAICPVCGAVVVLKPVQYYCKHEHYTVIEDNSVWTEYDEYSPEQHVKTVSALYYFDNPNSPYYPYYAEYSVGTYATCDDCGQLLHFYNDGDIAVGETDWFFNTVTQSMTFEAHSFENGVCTACGAREAAVEQPGPDPSTLPILDSVDVNYQDGFFNGMELRVDITGNEFLEYVKVKVTKPNGKVLSESIEQVEVVENDVFIIITAFLPDLPAGNYDLSFTALAADKVTAGNTIKAGVNMRKRPALQILRPKHGATIPAGQDLVVKWTNFSGVDYFDIVINNITTDTGITYQRFWDPTGAAMKYTLDGEFVEPGADYVIDVTAYGTKNGHAAMLLYNQVAIVTAVKQTVKPSAVAITADKYKLNPGETVQLGVRFTPANAESALSWKSSAPKIATVDAASGLVTGVAQGKATITVTTANNKTASAVIKVVDPAIPTGITLDKTGRQILNLGDTLSLTATLEPVDTAQSDIKWISSDETVATVEGVGLNAVVTPVKEGAAVITAKTVKPSAAGQRLSATVKVKVVDPTKPTAIALDKTGRQTLNLGGTLALTAALEPLGTAQSDIKWISSDETVATVEGSGLNATVTPVKEGAAIITAKAMKPNAAGQRLSAAVKVKVVNPNKPQQITIDQPSPVRLTLGGGGVQLTAKLEPESAMTGLKWISSDPEVASVDKQSGFVTPGGKAGRATITVKTTENGPGNKPLTAGIVVKVTDPKLPTGIVLQETEPINLEKGKQIELHAIVTPDTAFEDKLTWSSSDSTIAKVNQKGIVTALKRGTVNIRVTTSNGLIAKVKVIVVKASQSLDPSPVMGPTAEPAQESTAEPPADAAQEPTQAPIPEPAAVPTPEPVSEQAAAPAEGSAADVAGAPAEQLT